MSSFKKSQSLKLKIAFVNPDGSPADITGASAIKFMMKANEDDADAAALISKSQGSGVAVLVAAEGTAEVTLTAGDLDTLNISQVLCEGMAVVGIQVYRTKTYVFGVNKNLIKAIA